MGLKVYPAIEKKLRNKHGVSVEEVKETFLNRTGKIMIEERPKNQGHSPRYWFISESDTGRRLKVVFAEDGDDDVLITAYPPNEKEEALYEHLN